MHFMREALKGVPQRHRPMPDGPATLRISRHTGALASESSPDAITEIFMADRLPTGAAPGDESATGDNPDDSSASEPIF